MKALSIRADYVYDILTGKKTQEFRSWQTDYRGDLLICSTVKRIPDTIPGHAQCVVNLKDIKKLGDRSFAWELDKIRFIEPIPIKGKLHLFDVDDSLIHFATWNGIDLNNDDDDRVTDEITEAWVDKYTYPLYI